MRYDLREAVAQQEGKQRIKKIEQQHEALQPVGLAERVVPVALAFIKKEQSAKNEQGKREIFLRGRGPMQRKKGNAYKKMDNPKSRALLPTSPCRNRTMPRLQKR